MGNMIRTIIFDLGDVIVKVDKAMQFNRLAVSSGKTTAQIKEYFAESQLEKKFWKGNFSPRKFYFKIASDLDLNISFTEFKNIWCGIFALDKDIEKLIKNLKSHFKLVLLSNTDTLHFVYVKNRYNVINYFDEFILSYKTGYIKPNPLIFLMALKKAKTAPFNCLYIDDTLECVNAARWMGIKALQYKNFRKLARDLHKIGLEKYL